MKTCKRRSLAPSLGSMTSLSIAIAVLTIVWNQGWGQVPEQFRAAAAEQSLGDGAAPGIVISPGEDHRIGPGDVVEVQVNLAPEIST